ncbi:S-adenosyl-L-methionine-dependent methyltransferase [Vigna unguiculata]|uniref:S-adenosyl-L-methionine-dependent methyltransferase n=1 Tax=Vigna unguiculata TaxID=3917 RepID=A0A4D6MR64_VIGUN|nr:S-adenosyl-L-methionine-dependent methyltransferase [Vigna unguiculata]
MKVEFLTKYVRAIFEPLLAVEFGKDTMDELFTRFARKVAQLIEFETLEYTHVKPTVIPIAFTGRSARVSLQAILELALNQFLLHGCSARGRAVKVLLTLFPGLNDASVAGETRARTGNLAQASLAEARPNHFRGRSPRRPANYFERANHSPRREGSRLSEIPRWFLFAVSSPRLGEGELA